MKFVITLNKLRRIKQTGLIVSEHLNFAFRKRVGVSGAQDFRLHCTWKQQVVLFSLGFFLILCILMKYTVNFRFHYGLYRLSYVKTKFVLVRKNIKFCYKTHFKRLFD